MKQMCSHVATFRMLGCDPAMMLVLHTDADGDATLSAELRSLGNAVEEGGGRGTHAGATPARPSYRPFDSADAY